jgi:hypothetical protein
MFFSFVYGGLELIAPNEISKRVCQILDRMILVVNPARPRRTLHRGERYRCALTACPTWCAA